MNPTYWTDRDWCAVLLLAVFFFMLFYSGHVIGAQTWFTRIYNSAIKNGLRQPLRLAFGMATVIIAGLSAAFAALLLDGMGITSGCFYMVHH
jgi:hypothetical protein